MSCTKNDQPRMAVAGAEKKQGLGLRFRWFICHPVPPGWCTRMKIHLKESGPGRTLRVLRGMVLSVAAALDRTQSPFIFSLVHSPQQPSSWPPYGSAESSVDLICLKFSIQDKVLYPDWVCRPLGDLAPFSTPGSPLDGPGHAPWPQSHPSEHVCCT